MARRKPKPVNPLEVVNRFVDAANRHDAGAVAACVHRDFESLQPVHPARNFKGSAQLLNNWRAIFRTEPGFRLTMLRSALGDGTVWVELHGAGDAAEVAGIFIVGVEDGLIRWVRVYSELIEQVPETETPAPVLSAVPDPPESEAAKGEAEEAVEAVDAVEVAEAAVTAEEPAEIVEEPAEIVEEPAEIVEEPAEIVEEPAEIVEEPPAVAEKPAEATPAEEPAETTEEPAAVGEEPAAGDEEVREAGADGSLAAEPRETWSDDQPTDPDASADEAEVEPEGEASIVVVASAEELEPAILEAERAADSGSEPGPEPDAGEPSSGLEKWRRRLQKRPKGEA